MGPTGALPPNQREGNHKARASPATVRSGGSRRRELEHSVSKPDSASYGGNLAKSGKAQKLENIAGYCGCVQFKAGILNRGSAVPSPSPKRSNTEPGQNLYYKHISRRTLLRSHHRRRMGVNTSKAHQKIQGQNPENHPKKSGGKPRKRHKGTEPRTARMGQLL